jgi:two-component system chemotaxis sensor kinase CheA
VTIPVEIRAAEARLAPDVVDVAPAPIEPVVEAPSIVPSMEEPAAEPDSRLVAQSIRVNVDTLDNLINMVSELVLTRNELFAIVRRHEESEFQAPLQRLSNVTADLQQGIMKTRMQPVGNAWQKLPRIVRDLALELGKHIDIDMQGADTELDRQVLDLIRDPLTHMVRNSADHGLEMPAERLAAGKPERGQIRLSAYHEGGFIVISLADDGRGLNTDAIAAKAIASGLATEADIAQMSEAQIHRFIFMPGFSTASQITSISGRGVGMDVVRNNIDRIGGAVDVRSVLGEGTSFIVRIPLTLAIVSALIVRVGDERFAIPQLAVTELIRVREDSSVRIERVGETRMLRLRDRLLPMAGLGKLLALNDGDHVGTGFVVVMQVGSRSFGVMVDSVFDAEEIVVKPLSSRLRHIAMFSGATILGDGSVILIMDPNGIARAFGNLVSVRHDDIADVDDRAIENKTSMLVFRAGSRQPKALPLELVTRIERIRALDIEVSDGRQVLQYRGQLMPLIAVGGARVRGDGQQTLLVIAEGDRVMGLIVDDIIDIAEEKLDIEVTGFAEGILGSAVVHGHATEIVDVGHFMPMAFADWYGRKPDARAQRDVLLVDDSAFFRNMLSPVLRAAGYRVTVAADAEEALQALRSGQEFSVLLTDTDMPGMNGFDLARTVRADSDMDDMPIIALSAMVSEDALARGRQAGMHDHVAKFDRPGLIAALKERTAGMTQVA